MKIAKNIPIPGCGKGGEHESWPFGKLRVGHSFFVRLRGRAPASVQTKVMQQARKYPSRTFTTRRDGDGIRVWRTR